jgi:hypothetical protein
MKQLFEIKPNTPCYVNPKLPKLTVKIVKAGSSTTAKVDYDALYTAAYNKLTSDQQQSVTTALAQKTKYSCYPCSPADSNSTPTDWYNFTKYCVMTGNTSVLDTYALTWSAKQDTTGNTSSLIYTPDEATRKTALNAYNAYVNDAGKTTGTKPECSTIDVDTVWGNNSQKATRTS